MIGLECFSKEEETHFFHCEENIDILMINRNDLSLLFYREICGSLHSMHCHIKDIWELPEEERLKTSFFIFTLDRNKLSRSSIYKELKRLELKEYIDIYRGGLYNLKDTDNLFV